MTARVFCKDDQPLAPEAILAHLATCGFLVQGKLRGDELGWFQAELTLPEGAGVLDVERYRADEEGIRRELNTWAAWVEDKLGEETASPWMKGFITTAQVIVVQSRPPLNSRSEPTILALCRYLAQTGDGFYQIDSQGIFTAAGTLVVAENEMNHG